MNARWNFAALVFACSVAVSASAQGTATVGSVCKDKTTDATVGRGACSRHGGVDKTATAKAKAAADKAAKASATTASSATSSAAGSVAATVTCKDGTTGHAGRGACAHHGGVGQAAAQTVATATPASSAQSTSTKSKPAKSTSTTTKAGNGSSNKNDPTGAIAKCKDGTYSHAKQRTGACGHHGGVDTWL